MDPFLEIRKLPPSCVREIGQILDYAGSWKRLMSIIPKLLARDSFTADITEENVAKYNSEHIQIIEDGSKRLHRSCTEILFDEWGTSGRIRPTLGHLVYLLAKANLYRAADFVAVELLKKNPPSRPESGPAATVRVDLPNDLSKKSGKNVKTTVKQQLQIRTKSDLESLLNKIDYPENLSDFLGKSSNNLKVPSNKNVSLESLLNKIELPNTVSFYVETDSEDSDFEPDKNERSLKTGVQTLPTITVHDKIVNTIGCCSRCNQNTSKCHKKTYASVGNPSNTSDMIKFSSNPCTSLSPFITYSSDVSSSHHYNHSDIQVPNISMLLNQPVNPNANKGCLEGCFCINDDNRTDSSFVSNQINDDQDENRQVEGFLLVPDFSKILKKSSVPIFLENMSCESDVKPGRVRRSSV